MSFIEGDYIIEMPNGEKWCVPLWVIAKNRAKYYAKEYGGDEVKSLNEDTIPLFAADSWEIKDWARCNMNWVDVKAHATLVSDAIEINYQEGWVNGDVEIKL